MRRTRTVLVLLAILAIPLVLGELPPVRAAIVAAIEVMRGGSAIGVAAYFATYACGAVLTMPTWLLSGIAGYVWGPVHGVLLASPANAMGATLTFLLGRFVLAGPIGRRLADNPRWAAVRRAVGADAFRMGILLKVSPLAPQNLLGYGLALTPMRLGTFVAVTWLGMLPITFFHVYAGSLVHEVADLIEGKRPPMGVLGWVATAAALLVTGGALVAVAWIGKRALAKHGV